MKEISYFKFQKKMCYNIFYKNCVKGDCMLIFEDYRQDIVARKRNKSYWGQWSKWNVLYQTLAYELSSSKDVENYSYVRTKAFEYYAEYSQYVGNDFSADIMNGWWGCFKTIFGIKTGRTVESTKDFLRKLMEDIAGLNETQTIVYLNTTKKYSINSDILSVLMKFLSLVYTIGNITPIPKHCNINAGLLDCWEYKLFVSDRVYFTKPGYIEYLCYDDYNPNRKWWLEISEETADKTTVIYEYMKSRINLIEKRGIEILNRSKILA